MSEEQIYPWLMSNEWVEQLSRSIVTQDFDWGHLQADRVGLNSNLLKNLLLQAFLFLESKTAK
jgi:hypothetical protein